MNKKLFGRSGRRTRLQDLYRQAEQGGDLPDVDPELQQAFAADQRLRQQLSRLADQSAPVNPAIGRATFLAAVARKRSESLEEGRRPIVGRLLTGRALALLATAGIFAGGAVTVGASGGVSGAADNANNVLSTLHITHKAHDQEQGIPNTGDRPEAAGTPAAEGTNRAVEGIPTENPQHQPSDAAGTCDKDETIVKTPASGVAVNVPCQAGQDDDQGSGGIHSEKTRVADGDSDSEKTRVADETPGANATETGDHGKAGGPGDRTRVAGERPEASATAPADSGERADRTPVPLPTRQADHGGDATGH